MDLPLSLPVDVLSLGVEQRELPVASEAAVLDDLNRLDRPSVQRFDRKNGESFDCRRWVGHTYRFGRYLKNVPTGTSLLVVLVGEVDICLGEDVVDLLGR